MTLVLMLLATLGGCAKSTVPTVEHHHIDLTIGTWNMEWLNSKDDAGNKPRHQADYEALRRYAEQQRADVIAVQEVDGVPSAQRVFSSDKYDYHFASKACKLLAKQLPVLQRWIDDRASEPLPFLVMGDFNRRLKPNDPFWQEIDDSNPPNADLENFTTGHRPKCHEGQFAEFIDHFVTDRRAKNLVVPNSFRQIVYSVEDEHRYTLSDHCPLSVQLHLP